MSEFDFYKEFGPVQEGGSIKSGNASGNGATRDSAAQAQSKQSTSSTSTFADERGDAGRIASEGPLPGFDSWHSSNPGGNSESDTYTTFSQDDIEDGKALAVLAYLPFLCFIPYVKAKGKNNFAYHHGKQGLLLFLFEVVIVLVMLSWKVAILLAAVAALAGIIYALMGKIWRVPYIGVLADKLDKTHLFDHLDGGGGAGGVS